VGPIYEISMESGTHLTSGTRLIINWTKIKRNIVKRPKAWKRKRPNVGLGPFSCPELRFFFHKIG
jgi:hypothetical protein